MSVQEYARLFVDQLPLIDEVVLAICRRHRLPASEVEEFKSVVRLKLIENEYEVFRRFEARASLRTYLMVVIQRLFLDYRIQAWGKWRPSAEAKRLGSLAVRLEMLTVRDRLTFEEAQQVLLTQGVATTPEELETIRARLPRRVGRRLVGEEEARGIGTNGAEAESAVLAREQATVATRAQQALARALERFTPQDRLVLKMRFEDAFTVADIAKALRLDQKRLYRRVEQLLRELRAALEAEGVHRLDVAALLEQPEVEVRVNFLEGIAVESPAARPST